MNAKKTNWVKGIDRIVVLVAIPIAIFSAYYSYKSYIQSNGVGVWLTTEQEEEIKASFDAIAEKDRDLFYFLECTQIFGYPGENGIIADGSEELTRLAAQNPMVKEALERAFEEGADPSGSLVQYENYNFNNVIDGDLALIPRQSKRYLIGIIGGIGAAVGFILSIGSATRTFPRIFRWVYRGFKDNT
jgi:hypothetical protein